jgi:hypothetical protein
MSKFRLLLTSETGTTAVLFTLALPALLAGAGAATMYAVQLSTATEMQSALDAGTLAGTALPDSASQAARISAAQKAYDENIHSTGSDLSSSFWVQGGTAPKFLANKWEVTGKAIARIRNPFSFVIGDDWLPVSSYSAATKMESVPVCILGLSPTFAETIDFNGSAQLSANNCAVQANSNHGAGINQKGHPDAKATMIGVTGGYTGHGYQPLPLTGTVPIEDPYKDLPFPPASPCDFNDVKISNDTVTLEPGVYCGGLRVVAGAIVTLNKGIYVMKDGPLWINGGGTVQGDEVMIAFTGDDSTIYMEGSSELHVTSPAAGPYMNMQFMQQPGAGDGLWCGIVGNNKFSFDGVMYFPTQHVWFGGGTEVSGKSPSYAIVADKVWIQDQSVVNIDYVNTRGLPVEGSQGFMYGARLIK